MKYLKYSILLILMFAFTGTLLAQEENSLEVSTVLEVSQMEDGTEVMIEGFITEQSGEDEYIFADETAEIIIEAEEDSWKGQDINEEIKVRVVGVFHDDENQEKVSVETLEVIDF